MRIFLMLLFLPCAFSQPWCDIGEFCNSTYLCRAAVSIEGTGIAAAEPDFPSLLSSCGVPGEVDYNSIRVVHENILIPHALSNSTLLFTASASGEYLIYFSNLSENESKTSPVYTFSSDGTVSVACSMETLCLTGLSPCPMFIETTRPIYRAELTGICEQPQMGGTCTVGTIFGSCSCTAGYDQGYSTMCQSSCAGNFTNGTHAGVTATSYSACSVSIMATFYYIEYDFEIAIFGAESYFSYILPNEPAQPQMAAPPVGTSAPAPTPHAPPVSRLLSLAIIKPENGSTVDTGPAEFMAELNGTADCTLSLDGRQEQFNMDGGLASRLLMVEEGEHVLTFSCSAGAKREEVFFKAAMKKSAGPIAMRSIAAAESAPASPLGPAICVMLFALAALWLRRIGKPAHPQ